MTPLTEAELLRMREVQVAVASQGSQYSNPTEEIRGIAMRPAEFVFLNAARTDWPRVTEWALEARKLIATILDTSAVKRLDFEGGSPWIRTQVNEAWITEACRLLGE